jgi:hypothetical protein
MMKKLWVVAKVYVWGELAWRSWNRAYVGVWEESSCIKI